MRAQDDLSRQRRLSLGLCPTHGVGLSQTGVAVDKRGVPFGEIVGCPRKDCDFWAEVRPGSTLEKALHGAK